ncbi:MAG: ribonuclease Z [Desulfurococcus sp.]|nr:ribonuclease Z [Desulfurococcus sp.]
MNTRLFFLGTGAAIPLSRGLPCIAVKIDSNIYIFDIGEGCQHRMLKAGLSPLKVKAVFVTHPHGDHYLGLPGLIQTMRLSSRIEELRLLLPSGLEDYFKTLVEKGLLKPGFQVIVNPLASGEVYRDAKIAVKAFPVCHGVEAFGFRIEAGRRTICYTGDTMPCSTVIDNCKGVDVLIHESTFTSHMSEEAHEEYHSTARDAALIALEAGVSSLVLTHISSRHSDEEILWDALRFFYNTIVARDMMALYF